MTKALPVHSQEPSVHRYDLHVHSLHYCRHMSIGRAMDSGAEHRRVMSAVSELIGKYPPTGCSTTAFLAARYEAGLAWVHFEDGLGGLGVSPSWQALVERSLEMAGAPGPNANFVGVHQAAAAIRAYAPADMKRRWLRPAFTNQEFWCQLFSEPEAGSDLANIATTARHANGHWVVTGQKSWASFGDIARWGLLLARTDPDLPKHRGLTLFVLDMHDSGVQVRPCRTMDGARTFSTVDLIGAVVPERYQLGERGQGWRVIQDLLSTERGSSAEEDPTAWALETWQTEQLRLGAPAVLRDRVVSNHVHREVAKLLFARLNQSQGIAATFAPVVKLARNLVDQETTELAIDILGMKGMLGGDYERSTDNHCSSAARFAESRSVTIAGGTAEIMRNVIAERLLGLPSEVRPDKGMPWSQTRLSGGGQGWAQPDDIGSCAVLRNEIAIYDQLSRAPRTEPTDRGGTQP